MSKYLEVKKCPVCGKQYVPAPQHAYNLGNRAKTLVCSYPCQLKGRDPFWKEAKKKGVKEND